VVPSRYLHAVAEGDRLQPARVTTRRGDVQAGPPKELHRERLVPTVRERGVARERPRAMCRGALPPPASGPDAKRER